MTAIEKYEVCLSIYNDIVNGHTVVIDDANNEMYIKHLRDLDYSLFEQKKELYRKRGASKGLRTEREHLEILHSTNHWSRDEEGKYQNLLLEVSNLRQTRSKVFLEAQTKRIEDRIEAKEKELIEFSQYRNEIKVDTVEQYADGKMNDFIMTFCFYKDEKLKEPYFSEDSFGNLDLEEIKKYSLVYFEALRVFHEKNLARVGHSSVFLNNYLLSKGNPYHFFGKKIIDLTSYQSALCSHGNGCKNTLEHAENSMGSIEDIDDVIKWFERERKAIDKKFNGGKSKSSKSSESSLSSSSDKKERFSGIGVFDHNKEEFHQAAFDQDATPVDFVDAAEKLKKKLGKDELNAQDILSLHD